MEIIFRIAGSLALIAALGLTIGSARSGRASAAPTLGSRGRCSNIQVAVSPAGGNGAAGTITAIYRIHKLFGRPCTLFGYPGAMMLDRNFASLRTVVRRTGFLPAGVTPRLVQIGPHDAFFGLQYHDVPSGSGPCPSARYLLITPPNDYLPVVTYAAAHGASLMVCGQALAASPIEPSRSIISP